MLGSNTEPVRILETRCTFVMTLACYVSRQVHRMAHSKLRSPMYSAVLKEVRSQVHGKVGSPVCHEMNYRVHRHLGNR